MSALLHPLLALLLAPLLFGIINQTKAFFAGRNGVPCLQLYYDVIKLLKKGAVYSHTTTWIFRTGPVVGITACLLILAILPLARISSVLSFPGDFIVVAYFLGIMRFFLVISALDTGSSFEGMGANREVWFSTIAELPFFFSLIVLAKKTGSISLISMYGNMSSPTFFVSPGLMLIALALFIILLTENARIPIDDPNTHLELTMIHEVMVLDHSGPDFALILYGSALKLWIFGTLVIGLFLPTATGNTAMDILFFVGYMFLLAILIGIVESILARLKMVRIPQLLLCTAGFAILALCLK